MEARSRHNCPKRHRTYNALAKCIWDRPNGSMVMDLLPCLLTARS